MVKATKARKIGGAGLPGWPVGVVRHHMVEVAGPRRALAPREHARAVAETNGFGDSCGRLVPSRAEQVVEVDHRLHGDPTGVRAAAPLRDLPGGDQLTAGVLDPGGSVRLTGAKDLLGEVHVQNDVAPGG